MNERTLLIMAAVGASVVAYAVYALMTRAAVGERPTPVPTDSAPRAVARSGEVEPTPRPEPPRAKPALPVPAKPTGAPPPEVPMPEVSLEEAREDYEAFLGELERELQRNKETGKPLANEHWVEYYRRGHEVMDPLRRIMSAGSEEDRKEVGELDEALRDIMAKLQRDPAELEAEEAAQ